MMMTSGQAVKYKGSVDCAVQIIKGEGFMSLMKGAVPTSSEVLQELVCCPVSTSSRRCTSAGVLRLKLWKLKLNLCRNSRTTVLLQFFFRISLEELIMFIEKNDGISVQEWTSFSL